MKLLYPVLKKVHLDSLSVPIFLQPRLFVKRNNTELTNASCFTSICICSAHFALSGMELLAVLSSNNFSSLCLLKSPKSLPGESCWGPLCVACFSGNCNSSEVNSFGFMNSDIWELASSCRKFVYIISCLCVVFCTQKCIEGCTV